MTTEATSWAWKARVKPASLKLTLLALADAADAEHYSSPSMARLVSDVGLEIHQVRKHLIRLEGLGFITDAGRQINADNDGWVRVWRLNGVQGRDLS